MVFRKGQLFDQEFKDGKLNGLSAGYYPEVGLKEFGCYSTPVDSTEHQKQGKHIEKDSKHDKLFFKRFYKDGILVRESFWLK